MSNLQQLLDEKFPITKQTSEDGKRLYLVWRDIFAEGYNAAVEEIIPLLRRAHKSAVNKAVYKPLEEAIGVLLSNTNHNE